MSWGYHFIVDAKGSNESIPLVKDGDNIKAFIEELVPAIGMKAYGDPTIVHFAEHIQDAAGYSLVQLIETSSITCHFCDLNGDLYLDVFSCKEYDVQKVMEILVKYFKCAECNYHFLERNARS